MGRHKLEGNEMDGAKSVISKREHVILLRPQWNQSQRWM